MDCIKTLEGNLKNLKGHVEDLERFRDTYSKMIPEIQTLLKELFEKDSVKGLKTYDILKREYHDRIIAIFNPKNFTQLVIETSLPSIYDPPSIRNKKISTIQKVTNELKYQKKVAENKNAEKGGNKVPKTIPKIQKKVTTQNLKDSPYPEFNFVDFKKTANTPTTIKDPAIQTLKILKTAAPEHFSTNDLEFKRKHSQSMVTFKVADLEEPELMLIKIGNVKYCYDPDSLKIYEQAKDKPGVAILVGEIKDGFVTINGKERKLAVEDVYKFQDPATEEDFYQSSKKSTSYYQKLNNTDGWLIGLEEEQVGRLISESSVI